MNIIPTPQSRTSADTTTYASTSTVTVIGATGRVGSLVAREALARGHRVVVLVRDPGRLPADLAGAVSVVQGELEDPEAVSAAVRGSSAVIMTAGLRYRGKHPWSGVAGRNDVVPTAVRAVLDAVSDLQSDATGPATTEPHLVLLSAVGAGDSWSSLPAVVRAVISTSALKVSYAGLTEGEQLLRTSGRRHTVVRAVTLTDAPASGGDVDATDRRLRGNPKVSRADLARLLTDVAQRPAAGRTLVAAG